MIILICGDRNWTDKEMIDKAIDSLYPFNSEIVIIHGNANGADRLGAECALRKGLKVKSFRALWEKYGKSAGPIRNRQMLKEGKPDEVWAFHDNLSFSKGTADMVKISLKNGITVYQFSHEWESKKKLDQK